MTGTESATDILGLARAWNCPAAYIHADYDEPASWHDWPQPVTSAYQRACKAPNWFWEQDAALEAMVEARDADAIREWADHDFFFGVAHETGDPDDDKDNRDYAKGCVDALMSLASAVDDWMQPNE